MTYNFDPDQWFDIQTRLLKKKLEEGLINQKAHDAALEELEDRLEEMWRNLDGTFQIED